MDDRRVRLRWRTLAAQLHLYRCGRCGREPIVTLDAEHEPIMACRYCPDAELETT